MYYLCTNQVTKTDSKSLISMKIKVKKGSSQNFVCLIRLNTHIVISIKKVFSLFQLNVQGYIALI